MKRELYFDGSSICSQEEFHGHFAELMGFPSYYGHNLDDLWTCMTSYINPQVRLTIHDFNNLIKVFGAESEALREIFTRLPESLPDFELLLN